MAQPRGRVRIQALASFVALASLSLGLSSSAQAFSIYLQRRGANHRLQASDSIAIDVFIDYSGPGQSVADLSVAVLFDPRALSYDAVASAALPVLHVGYSDSGAQPSYIFYANHSGLLYPSATPAFSEWGSPPPGRGQVNIDYYYQEDRTNGGTYMWLGTTWLGSLVFHVDDDALASQIELSLSAGGTGIEESPGVLIDPAEITLGAPVLVPEPSTLLLVTVGTVAASLSHRGRRGRGRAQTTTPLRSRRHA